MSFKKSIKICILSAAIVAAVAMPLGAAFAADDYVSPFADQDRTTGRSVNGDMLYPKWLLQHPEHYEFSPLISNHDPQNRHPAQWEGQDWDPSMWNENWTPEKTIDRLFQNGVFAKQFIRREAVPVLVLGPTFFKLSDLDQRRSIKLVTDYSDLFNRGYEMVELRDWHSGKTVGSYTHKGMQLN